MQPASPTMSSHPAADIHTEYPHEYAAKSEEEAEDEHLASARWWVLTTLFPLVCGTFGPLATSFNICALTQDSREVVDPTSTEQEGTFVPNPAWYCTEQSPMTRLTISGHRINSNRSSNFGHCEPHPSLTHPWTTSLLTHNTSYHYRLLH